MALKAQDRPFDETPISTSELPDLPQRDYRIPASAWRDAPDRILALGSDLGEPVEYKRRIGPFLLWRAGPPVGRARYAAVADDLSAIFVFELDGRTGSGIGPDGVHHVRFRTWKESLRDAGAPP